MPADQATGLVEAIHAELLADEPARAADPIEVAVLVRHRHPLLAEPEVIEVARAVSARATGLGPLEPFLG
jgi:hypothetical protein